MMESDNVSFRSHVHSVDHGVSIVFDTSLLILHEGLLSFRMKEGVSPEVVHDLISKMYNNVEKIEFHFVHKPIFEKV